MGESLQSVMKKASKKKRTQQKQLPLSVCIEVFQQYHRARAQGSRRDIKSTSILLRHKLTSTIHDVDVVLAGWNLAIAICDKQPKSGRVGTRSYLPPKVLLCELPFSTRCDVWAAADATTRWCAVVQWRVCVGLGRTAADGVAECSDSV